MTRRESRPVRLPRPVRLGVCAAVLCGTVLAGTATGQQAPDPLVTSGAESWLARVVPANLTPPSSIPPIAIIETGFDSTHPEMQGGWITQRRPSPQPDPADAAAVSQYAQDVAHGTAVASIIGAPRNGVGMEGVLPGATVWVYGNSDSCPDVAAAVRQAARDGARVIDMSLGFTKAAACAQLADAATWALGKNALVVAAAGRSWSGQQWIQPSTDWHVFTVGAVNPLDQTTSFSQHSNALDMTAPGEGVLAATTVALDVKDGAQDGYTTWDGTGFSAPMVAAAAAWVMADRPDLSAGQVADVLRFGARDLGPHSWDRAYGWGAVNIAGALAQQAPAKDPLEPNEDVRWVNGRAGLPAQPPLLGRKRSLSLRATLDLAEDPYDAYRVSIPLGRTVRIRVVSPVRLSLAVYDPTPTLTDRRAPLVAWSAQPGRTTQEVTVKNDGVKKPLYIGVRILPGPHLAGWYTLTIQTVP